MGAAGGGIYSTTALELSNTTVSQNFIRADPSGYGSASGGGIFFAYRGPLTVAASTISLNEADARYWSQGGGLYLVTGGINVTPVLVNTTISANTANGAGPSALLVNHNDGGAIWLISSTVTGNVNNVPNPNNPTATAIWAGHGYLHVRSTIIDQGQSGCGAAQGGFVVSRTYNIDSGGSCGFFASGDRPRTNPLLGPLQNNGGPTQTHALLPGSPAIDWIPQYEKTQRPGLYLQPTSAEQRVPNTPAGREELR
jgi:hypothetical protein